ncbi:MAG: chemotaxis protein CheW [Nevskia sp.]|nr:chemotaxis protein CheW [Nevskia sp.]
MGIPEPASGAAQPAEHGQYLKFQLGEETFAVGILNVKEIIEYGNLTPVPMMPECIRGVINLRGAVVPVIDLACRFGRRGAAITRRTCIVIIEMEHGEAGRQDIGVVVDAVSAVVEIRAGEIEPPPAFGTHLRIDFIRGMGKVDGHFVIILDVAKVLSLEDLALLAQAGAAGTSAVDAAAA